jgi:hypothetical protein
MASAAWNRVCSFVRKYEKVVQVLAAGTIAGSGDVGCQILEMKWDHAAKRLKDPSLPEEPPTMIERLKKLDFTRALAVSAFGFFISGPVGAYWYPGIDKFMVTRLPHFKRGSLKFVFTKVVLEEICLGPLFTAAFFVTVGLAEGNTKDEILAKLKRDYVKTLVVDELGWFIISPITYAFVPIHWQLVWNSCISAVEAAFFSYIQHNGFPAVPILGIEGIVTHPHDQPLKTDLTGDVDAVMKASSS